MSEILVIGYGNTLRRDDGVGPIVAETVGAWSLPGVSALRCHQLTPELAGVISEARSVIFVDAALNSAGAVKPREIEAGESVQIITHTTDPRSLLGLAIQLFGRCPAAWLVEIPVADLEFGEGLSQLAEEGVQTALKQIEALAAQLR